MSLLETVTVENVMVKNVVTVRNHDIMTVVANIFDNQSFNHLPVVDAGERVVGIVSRHDYNQLQHHFSKMLFKEARQSNERLFAALTVKEVMTKNPVCLEVNSSLKEVFDLLINNRYHSVLVMDSGKLAGIITPADLLKWAMGVL